jgi:hypothetical protein
MNDEERYRAEVDESHRVIRNTLEKADLPLAIKDALIAEVFKLRRSAFEEGYAQGRKKQSS